MNALLKEISDIGILPVIKINDAKKAVPLAKALIDGGLPAAEVTFRTDAAEESIKEISKEFPDMLVGAGTVLTPVQAEKAKNAGAKFIVSPGLNPKVVQWCKDNDILVVPGVCTPSEIEQAMELGLDTVKFFPAEQSGGIAKIKAMSAPYTSIKFMPTGGINLDNLNDYLKNNKILACGGSFMVKESLIDSNNWSEITALTKKAVEKMLGMEILHVGVNVNGVEEAKEVSGKLSDIMYKDLERDSEIGVFVGSDFEIMKHGGRGKCGHIAVSTNSIDRAIYHLSKKGFVFDMETAKYDANGKTTFIYLKDEIGGFGIHFILK